MRNLQCIPMYVILFSIFMGLQSGGYLLVQRITDQISSNLYFSILVGLCPFISNQTGCIGTMGTFNCTIKLFLLVKERNDIKLNRITTLQKLHFHILNQKFNDRVISLPSSC